ncbi:sodium ion-translocating decarboxylase, beta subunit [Anaerolinea thermolimosa]|uniref:sodium ion-translocating decarboxylase subunit beta n=1 Tax=Anaerolinea thermolimosa TaxID=229919 RepID=UPI000780B013|nr:sodium ion-translocating decarboxylase subunit beta [Anaerolinea thermolimosa]GAP05654.1 sodium ion-translocating decarboxylase, beta subunit [Anaerolinea thermolimosa]
MNLSNLSILLEAFRELAWQNFVMLGVGGILIFLAIRYEFEPNLLLPIGFGALLANLPLTGVTEPGGFLKILYDAGIRTELFPLFIFIGIGAMTDFGPLLENPRMALLGAAGQFGIFMTLMLALLAGFRLNEAASIGIIGAIDGPTAIYVSSKLAPHLLPAITVTAYSYMSLVPIIQPPIMRLMTSRRERRIRMPYTMKPVSHTVRVLFPIVVTVLVSLLVPKASPLISTLMFGNLLRESGVVERLSRGAQNELANLVTLFLGLVIGSTMEGQAFLKLQTVYILGLGLLAFALDTVGGVLFGKLMNFLSGGRFNPCIGAAGISAFPMSARIVQRFISEEDFENFLLMHAMGANAAGQLGSVVAGGVVLAVLAGVL